MALFYIYWDGVDKKFGFISRCVCKASEEHLLYTALCRKLCYKNVYNYNKMKQREPL
jgi:hypothetical protein